MTPAAMSYFPDRTPHPGKSFFPSDADRRADAAARMADAAEAQRQTLAARVGRTGWRWPASSALHALVAAARAELTPAPSRPGDGKRAMPPEALEALTAAAEDNARRRRAAEAVRPPAPTSPATTGRLSEALTDALVVLVDAAQDDGDTPSYILAARAVAEAWRAPAPLSPELIDPSLAAALRSLDTAVHRDPGRDWFGHLNVAVAKVVLAVLEVAR